MCVCVYTCVCVTHCLGDAKELACDICWPLNEVLRISEKKKCKLTICLEFGLCVTQIVDILILDFQSYVFHFFMQNSKLWIKFSIGIGNFRTCLEFYA